ncbi:Hint domain-containing protein, partial [Methylorubrum zatmanii]
MGLPIVFNGNVFPAGYIANNNSYDAPGEFTALKLTPEAYTLTGTVSSVGDLVRMTNVKNGLSFDLYATGYDNSGKILFNNSKYLSGIAVLVSNTPLEVGQYIAFAENKLGDYVVRCFVSGTRISVERGSIPVELLRIGEKARLASGGVRTITWIGHREIKAEVGMLSADQQPVRVRAGAFGDNLPARDLFLSPGHPVLIGADADNKGGVLVPVMCLINGTSITRQPRMKVTYWHVEL